MIQDPWFYAVAIPAMFVLGLSKGGFGIVGLLTVPILAVAIPPVQAAGIVLPILILSDMVALWSYWRTWDRDVLVSMLPGAMIGIGVGWATAALVTDDEIRLILGVMSVAFALNYWLRQRKVTVARPRNRIAASLAGAASGFTSFVSHAGGPPYQMYVAPLRLEPRVFAGTSVLFFAIVNATKAVPYFFLGQFRPENLLTSAVLLPFSIPATLFGVWLVKRIEPRLFYELTYAFIFVIGLYLALEGAGVLP